MEDYVFLGGILMVGIFSIVVMQIFKGKTKVKQTKKTAEQGLNDVYEDTIKRQASELKKQTGRANRFQALYQNLDDDEEEDVEEIEGGKEVKWKDIEQLVKTSYPQYTKYLDNAAVRYYVMNKIKGMTMKEVLDEIQPLIGDIKPKSGTQTDELQNNPQFA